MDEVPYEFVQGGGYVGPDFTPVFFYEDIFWRVRIPLLFGSISVNTLNSLIAMPPEVKGRLKQDPIVREDYISQLE